LSFKLKRIVGHPPPLAGGPVAYPGLAHQGLPGHDLPDGSISIVADDEVAIGGNFLGRRGDAVPLDVGLLDITAVDVKLPPLYLHQVPRQAYHPVDNGSLVVVAVINNDVPPPRLTKPVGRLIDYDTLARVEIRHHARTGNVGHQEKHPEGYEKK